MPESLGHNRENEPLNLGGNVSQPYVWDASSKKDGADGEPEENNEAEEKGDKEEQTLAPAETYNLIILDKSGSMSCVRPQTISGCNETLNTIRHMAKEQPDNRQYVSIFCFDNINSRYLFEDVAVEYTHDLTEADYRPYGNTPLYDAVGYTVSRLERRIADSEAVAVVTIITDGYENSSRRWTLRSVAALIERLKRKGWVFTFIGANIDVDMAAKGLGIDSFVEFRQTEEGMNDMFEKERRSRMAYNMKLKYMHGMSGFSAMPSEAREEMLGSMNSNYFVDKKRVAPDFIKTLADNEIFVFGSNVRGQHSGGAALFAKEHFGAEEGKAEGPQGRSYAIPTHGNSFGELKEAVGRFTKYAVLHPQCKFMLSAVGCGAAGYTVKEIAPLFRQAYSFGNVYVPEAFLPFMPKDLDFFC